MGGKRAIVIQIPVRLQRQFQKVQTRLIRELEKKFSGRTVVFMAWVSAAATAGLDVCLESSWSQSVHVCNHICVCICASTRLTPPSSSLPEADPTKAQAEPADQAEATPPP